MSYLNAKFAADGYRVPDLMRRIVTSEAFYRIAPEQTVATNAAKESAQ
jgi:hypothetical protein